MQIEKLYNELNELKLTGGLPFQPFLLLLLLLPLLLISPSHHKLLQGLPSLQSG